MDTFNLLEVNDDFKITPHPTTFAPGFKINIFITLLGLAGYTSSVGDSYGKNEIFSDEYYQHIGKLLVDQINNKCVKKLSQK